VTNIRDTDKSNIDDRRKKDNSAVAEVRLARSRTTPPKPSGRGGNQNFRQKQQRKLLAMQMKVQPRNVK